MKNLKIIVTGPVGAGKTTAIASVSEIRPIVTDVVARGVVSRKKAMTTVVMDYGVVNRKEQKIHLYGTPGQQRFDFMWDLLVTGGFGLIMLIDNTSRNPFKDLEFFIDAHGQFLQHAKLVIGVTRQDIEPNPSIEDYREYLKKAHLSYPVIAADARVKSDISRLLNRLLVSSDSTLEAA